MTKWITSKNSSHHQKTPVPIHGCQNCWVKQICRSLWRTSLGPSWTVNWVWSLLLTSLQRKYCSIALESIGIAGQTEPHKNTLDWNRMSFLLIKSITDQSGVHSFQSAAIFCSRAVSRANWQHNFCSLIFSSQQSGTLCCTTS